MKSILGKILALALLSGVCYGDDYDNAQMAYEKKDYKKAFKLYNKSCDNGDAYGCNMVGLMYQYGTGIGQNTTLALKKLQQSCDMGIEIACDALPVCKIDNSLSSLSNKLRYFEISSEMAYPIMLVDDKTIEIDKKNKIIKAWIIQLSSVKHKKELAESMGGNSSLIGYHKKLYIIDYKYMESTVIESIGYSCYDIEFSHNKYDEDKKVFSKILQGSVMEDRVKNIMKKYNLK
jgi:hypothetical protein